MSVYPTRPADKAEAKDDPLLWPFAFVGAFAAGAGLVLIVALVGRVDTLRDQLQREREGRQPTVVVVEARR